MANKEIPNVALQNWLKKASIAMRKRLAILSGTSVQMFRQLASGRRNCSADLAGRLEQGTIGVAKEYRDAPHPIPRSEFCDACSRCPYFIEYMREDDDLK